MDLKQQVSNYEDVLKSFAIGYNKSVTVSSVTANSFQILQESMDSVCTGLQAIVSAFEEMQATSKTTASHTDQIDSMMDEILKANDSLKQEIENRVVEIDEASKNATFLSSSFRELKEQTKKVTDITGSIQEVVDKTNVLAINASIEAAHAGSFGAGFKIIANEVHKLAGQTGEFAKQITDSIKTFESTVERVNNQMNEFTELISRFNVSLTSVLETFKDNASSIHTSGKALSEITFAVREEANALAEGFSALSKANASVRDTYTILNVIGSMHGYLDELLSTGM
ncbi:MAG: methyl-accepting chemotaxis protein [Treponema sp.]